MIDILLPSKEKERTHFFTCQNYIPQEESETDKPCNYKVAGVFLSRAYEVKGSVSGSLSFIDSFVLSILFLLGSFLASARKSAGEILKNAYDSSMREKADQKEDQETMSSMDKLMMHVNDCEHRPIVPDFSVFFPCFFDDSKNPFRNLPEYQQGVFGRKNLPDELDFQAGRKQTKVSRCQSEPDLRLLERSLARKTIIERPRPNSCPPIRTPEDLLPGLDGLNGIAVAREAN